MNVRPFGCCEATDGGPVGRLDDWTIMCSIIPGGAGCICGDIGATIMDGRDTEQSNVTEILAVSLVSLVDEVLE